MNTNAVHCKAQLLANGIAIDSSVMSNFNPFFIEKRRAYGIQDPEEYLDKRIPQELIILPENIICSINVNPSSPWTLKYSEDDQRYFIQHSSVERTVTFPARPQFYDKVLRSDKDIRVNQIISLYGGRSIGAFLIRECCFENKGVCHFCSLCNNHKRSNDFYDKIDPNILIESISIALEEEYPITQIMLNGGNKENLDENFEFYVERTLSVRKYLDNIKRSDIELHLIVSPPKDLNMIEALIGANVKIAMNMETNDDALFDRYCPGKNRYIGHKHIFNALNKAVKLLGVGNVYSIFVGGLEPLESLNTGISILSKEGIIPVINVLHVDPNTLISIDKRPTVDYIMAAGKHLQSSYQTFPREFVPFYKNCGRNSLDTEAYDGLFTKKKD